MPTHTRYHVDCYWEPCPLATRYLDAIAVLEAEFAPIVFNRIETQGEPQPTTIVVYTPLDTRKSRNTMILAGFRTEEGLRQALASLLNEDYDCPETVAA